MPSYINPSETSAWQTIDASRPALSIAFLNVDSGPGTSAQAGFSAQVNQTEAAGIAVYAYVSTEFGTRSLADDEAQVNAYATFYGVHNILEDTASTDCSLVPTLYLPLYQYIHAHGGSVVMNPGTQTNECYMQAADVIQTFEGTYSDYVTGFSQPSWMADFPASRFYNVVHTTPNQADMENAVTLSTQRHIGNIYVTDLTEPNPYDGVPSFWAAELQAVEAT